MSRQLPFDVRALVRGCHNGITKSRLLQLSAPIVALVASAGLISFGLAKDDATVEKSKGEASTAGKEPDSSATGQTAVERALAQPINLDFVEIPLKDVAESISKKTGINVMLDIKAITDAGGSADTPITFSIKRIPLRSALRLMLQDHELNFITDSGADNVLLITSDTKAKEHVLTRIYDAHDLATPVRTLNGSELKLDELIGLITSNIAPTSWSDAGGTGSLAPCGMQLIVSQTAEIHEQIPDLLTAIREVRDFPQKIIDAGGSVGLVRTGREAAIHKWLQNRQDLDFQEVPLKNVVEALKKSGVEIQIDKKAITDSGASVDLPITFKGKQLRLDWALRTLLQEHELNYVIDHEVLLITSDTKAKEHVVIDYYPVGDLIGDTSGRSAKEIEEAYSKIRDFITSTIAPTSWVDAGGVGSLASFPLCKALVCAQMDEIQNEVATALAKLRAIRSQEGANAQPNQPAPAVATRIYQLALDHADAAADYVSVIRNLVEPKTWTSPDYS